MTIEIRPTPTPGRTPGIESVVRCGSWSEAERWIIAELYGHRLPRARDGEEIREYVIRTAKDKGYTVAEADE